MQAHHSINQYLEQWSCHTAQRLVLAWWHMSGDRVAKRDPNKSVFFWRKKFGTCFFAISNNNNISREKTQKKEEEKQKQLEKREK